MKAMIFSAGLGTRFKPWTDKHPKALALVNGKSLLQRNIEYLQQYGIRQVIINVHHFADQIIEAVMKNNGWGSTVTISDERDEVLETGGGLMKAQEFFMSNEAFVTINVDILTNLDLNNLIEFHRQQQSFISFGVTARKTSRYFLFDEQDRLCGWRNTQTNAETIVINKPGLTPKAYSCVVVFQPEIFSKMPFTGKFSLKDVYLELAAGYPIKGFDHSGDKLVDVGKPESIAIAESLFA
jgi:N-acetyl-alpha-D-muramate 1-phosphate uridylyltransferase